MKQLECITCDKIFELNEIFIAHITNEKVDCSQCLKCVDRIGASTKIELNGYWAVLKRNYEDYDIIN